LFPGEGFKIFLRADLVPVVLGKKSLTGSLEGRKKAHAKLHFEGTVQYTVL
jgi:hypothetical protein